jgi:DNA helicase-2/ATP-dependent DNA helicase PcrA
VRSRTGVTIVGDANQKIIPEADFMGWDALARELGVSGATVARLEVPHRSTAPIMALADALVGDAPQAGRAGLTPRLSVVPPEGQIDRLASAIRGFLAERPNAHVAVVCGRAREVDAVLGEVSARLRGDGLSVRVGQREAFSFSPGVTVTNLRQIKGLEFDAVFALDVNDDRYPSDDQGRRWLYTLVTRAKDVVHLFSTGAPATLLQPAIAAGLVALDAAEDIPVFDPASDTDEPF